jgi:soluble P-type ATPase
MPFIVEPIAMLADAEMNVAVSRIDRASKICRRFDVRVVRGRQVARAADQLRKLVG